MDDFFKATAPVLFANLLTLVFVLSVFSLNKDKYARAAIVGWVVVLGYMLYGLYLWGVYPFKRHEHPSDQLSPRQSLQERAPPASASGSSR
jgi:hypothetical protein